MTVDQTETEVPVRPGEAIQEVLDSAGPGATLRLSPGSYPGNIVIRHSGVTLLGAGAGQTELVPGPVTAADIPALHDADPGVVSGISIHGDGLRDVTIAGLTVRGFSGSGVYAHSITGLRCTDVTARDNGPWGIYVRESARISVRECTASGSQYAGIGLSFCSAADAVVAHNQCFENAYGIFIDNTSDAQALHNTCRRNAAGIMLLHQVYPGEPPGGVRDCLVADNDLRDNHLAAGGEEPDALGAAGPPISGVGIAMIGTERVSVVGNRLTDNRPGGPSVMGAALVMSSSAEWGGSDATGNLLLWNKITGNEPCDVSIDVDADSQTFASNVVGTSEPADLPGRRQVDAS